MSDYSVRDIIYYVKVSLLLIPGPLCVAISALFMILSDKSLCKINTYFENYKVKPHIFLGVGGC